MLLFEKMVKENTFLCTKIMAFLCLLYPISNIFFTNLCLNVFIWQPSTYLVHHFMYFLLSFLYPYNPLVSEVTWQYCIYIFYMLFETHYLRTNRACISLFANVMFMWFRKEIASGSDHSWKNTDTMHFR